MKVQTKHNEITSPENNDDFISRAVKISPAFYFIILMSIFAKISPCSSFGAKQISSAVALATTRTRNTTNCMCVITDRGMFAFVYLCLINLIQPPASSVVIDDTFPIPTRSFFTHPRNHVSFQLK
jgi:hypothetical protein